MTDFRENYLQAREIVAEELKQKFNLIETYKEYDCITLDSSTNSIHLTFIVPDGDEIYISGKGEEWFKGKSFKNILFERYPLDNERTEAIKKVFQGSTRHPFSFKVEEIKSSFRSKLDFLQDLSFF